MARRRTALVHVGIRGHVLALHRESGTEVWRAKLPAGRVRSHSFVHLYRDQERLYATFNGEMFCLDAASGALLWQNPLKGLGLGIVSVAGEPGSEPAGRGAPASLLGEHHRRQQQRSQAGAS